MRQIRGNKLWKTVMSCAGCHRSEDAALLARFVSALGFVLTVLALLVSSFPMFPHIPFFFTLAFSQSAFRCWVRPVRGIVVETRT